MKITRSTLANALTLALTITTLAACGGGGGNPVGPQLPGTQPLPSITSTVTCCTNPVNHVTIYLATNPLGDTPDPGTCRVGNSGETGYVLDWDNTTQTTNVPEDAILGKVNQTTKKFPVTCKFRGYDVTCEAEWPKCAKQPGCNTCQPTCTKDQWTCGSWGACSDGRQYRTCNKTFDCPSANNGSPATSQGCGVNIPAVNCEVGPFSLSSAGAWSACSASGQQTRTETWTRNITRQPSNGGQACPALSENRTGSQPCTPPSTCGGTTRITGFSASSTTVSAGQMVTFNFSTQYATVCTVSGAGWTSGNIGPNGSYSHTIDITQTVGIDCRCTGNPDATSSLSVTVN